MATPLTDIDAAKPISINKTPNYPSSRQALRAYGYGLTENKIASDHLREAEVTYISNDECFGRGIRFNNVLQSNEVMCTDPFDDKTATCLGDSGGPLTDSSGNTLVGIISFGSGCEADFIPDGHVRLSEVSDWIEEQICLLSANPPASCATTSQQRDPRSVEVVVDFTHDFFPEHTSFSVQSKKTYETVYAGPEYIPKRNGNHKESLFLLPGEYTFDVYDTEGDGLVSTYGNGSWKLSALYDGCTATEIATGEASFSNQQATRFVVSERTNSNNCGGYNNAISDELSQCLDQKEVELAVGTQYSTTCDCAPNASSGAIELSCLDATDRSCAYLYQTCTTSTDCCSGRRCTSGQCRSSSQSSSGNRDSKRIGDTSVGGAAARSARNSGNLRG
mmetsp:Transcript_6737/g.16549  ORF Transcript_6737/g.16549 Transcript_6737/m.16549 type:complete len:391 (-) Transcript_6737:213-1385(-)